MARTRFQRADQADSDCTPGSDGNKPLLSAQTGGNQTLTASVPQGNMANAFDVFSFTMAAGDPGGGEDLPAGSLFRLQLDITVLGAQLAVRVEFSGLNATCTQQGTVDQVEADITAIGLGLVTATWDPPVSDRYQVRIGVEHSGMHTDPAETITIRTNNVNAFFEIPDAPVAGVNLHVRPRQVLPVRQRLPRSLVARRAPPSPAVAVPFFVGEHRTVRGEGPLPTALVLSTGLAHTGVFPLTFNQTVVRHRVVLGKGPTPESYVIRDILGHTGAVPPIATTPPVGTLVMLGVGR